MNMKAFFGIAIISLGLTHGSLIAMHTIQTPHDTDVDLEGMGISFGTMELGNAFTEEPLRTANPLASRNDGGSNIDSSDVDDAIDETPSRASSFRVQFTPVGLSDYHEKRARSKRISPADFTANEGDTVAVPTEAEKLLLQACRAGNIDAVSHFIQRGTCIRTKNRRGETPLHCALKTSNRSPALIKLLVEHGACIDDTCFALASQDSELLVLLKPAPSFPYTTNENSVYQQDFRHGSFHQDSHGKKARKRTLSSTVERNDSLPGGLAAKRSKD